MYLYDDNQLQIDYEIVCILLIFVLCICMMLTIYKLIMRLSVFAWCICTMTSKQVDYEIVCFFLLLYLYLYNVFTRCICMMPSNYKLIMRLSVFEAEAALACSARVTAPLGIELRYFSSTLV